MIASSPEYDVHASACVDQPCRIGAGTKIWHFCHVMAGAEIGKSCNLGQNVFIAAGVLIGNNVKIQNNVSIYAGTVIEDDVFLGPSCVFTNVTNPRAQVNRHDFYETTCVKRGASIGANATILGGKTLGRYCFVAAGAVITRHVPDYALMVGVPARQRGWMSRHGHPLQTVLGDRMRCPESGLWYQETEPGIVRCLDLNEEESLPPELAKGKLAYAEFHPH
jgi:UDP-2-acetamido-3-amino-2,3-dideoxy-glucuronate N-acetyltransferase